MSEMTSMSLQEQPRTRVFCDNYGEWRWVAITNDGREVSARQGVAKRDDAIRQAREAGFGENDGYALTADGITSTTRALDVPLPKIDPQQELIDAGVYESGDFGPDEAPAVPEPPLNVRQVGVAEETRVTVRQTTSHDDHQGDPRPQGIGPAV